MASDQGAGHPRPDGKPHAASRDAGTREPAVLLPGPLNLPGLRAVVAVPEGQAAP